MNLYEKDVKQKEPHEAITVVIFTLDDLDGLSENVGHTQAQEVIQSLGEYVNKHFGDMGISTRLGRDQIATILPQADRNSADRMLNDFVRELQEQGLGDIRSEAQAESPSAEGYTFSISVGVAEGKASEDIEITSERARSEQKTVARFRC
jgi:GGDEF domain-containing protein